MSFLSKIDLTLYPVKMCANMYFESHGEKQCLLREKCIELQFTEYLEVTSCL